MSRLPSQLKEKENTPQVFSSRLSGEGSLRRPATPPRTAFPQPTVSSLINSPYIHSQSNKLLPRHVIFSTSFFFVLFNLNESENDPHFLQKFAVCHNRLYVFFCSSFSSFFIGRALHAWLFGIVNSATGKSRSDSKKKSERKLSVM